VSAGELFWQSDAETCLRALKTGACALMGVQYIRRMSAWRGMKHPSAGAARRLDQILRRALALPITGIN